MTHLRKRSESRGLERKMSRPRWPQDPRLQEEDNVEDIVQDLKDIEKELFLFSSLFSCATTGGLLLDPA